MPLVEIVRGARTSEATVRRVARLAVELGKTPVVVKDVAGFLVNRLLGPYLDEALRLVAHGAHPDRIDEMMLRFGMPMGPCELVDEVGLDIAAHAGASLERAYGSRMQATRFLAPLIDAGELGKKSGKGLFEWGSAAKGRAAKIARNQRAFPAGAVLFTLSDEEALDRLLLAFVNEAARALEEGVVAGPKELDLACVFGTGFAPFRGGPLAYADERGIAKVVEALRSLETSTAIDGGRERRGRFEPAPLLVDLAKRGGRFHG
jgi:3-hydroxyacyl-CoA dehydrogenase